MRSRAYERVLGVYPCQTGFAFAVIERRRGLIDWGEAELGLATDEEFVARLTLHIERSSPGLLAVENRSHSARGAKARRRVNAALALSRRLGLKAQMVSRAKVRSALSIAADATKHEVAERLCDFYPELAHQRPVRLVWRKDPRMNVFDAVALATAAFGNALLKR